MSIDLILGEQKVQMETQIVSFGRPEQDKKGHTEKSIHIFKDRGKFSTGNANESSFAGYFPFAEYEPPYIFP